MAAFGQDLADAEPSLVDSGQMLVELGSNCLRAECWSTLVRFGPCVFEIKSKSTEVRPTLVDPRPSLINLGRIRAKTGRNQDKVDGSRVEIGRVLTNAGQSLPSSGRFGQIWAMSTGIGRLRQPTFPEFA